MQYYLEKIIKRDDGSRVKIKVEIIANQCGNAIINYFTTVFVYEPKNNLFFRVVTADNEKVVTPAEIHQVKLDLWQSIKPKDDDNA